MQALLFWPRDVLYTWFITKNKHKYIYKKINHTTKTNTRQPFLYTMTSAEVIELI